MEVVVPVPRRDRSERGAVIVEKILAVSDVRGVLLMSRRIKSIFPGLNFLEEGSVVGSFHSEIDVNVFELVGRKRLSQERARYEILGRWHAIVVLYGALPGDTIRFTRLANYKSFRVIHRLPQPPGIGGFQLGAVVHRRARTPRVPVEAIEHHPPPCVDPSCVQTVEWALDAPDLVDGYYRNLLDWVSSNVLSIALGNTVYSWNATNAELVTVDEDLGPVMSVSWAPDDQRMALSLNNSHIQLCDSTSSLLVRLCHAAFYRAPLCDMGPTVFMPPLRSSLPNPQNRHSNNDRFIPDRSSIDFDFAHFQLTESRREKENAGTAASSPAKEAYRKLLAGTLLNNRTRILSFKSKPPVPCDGFLHEPSSNASTSHTTKSAKQRRYISQTAERTLDAPDLVDNYYLNLLDWGSSNVLSIALGNTVYLWNATDGSTSELVTVDEDLGPVTSVSWAPDGQHIALGLNNSHIQLWDSTSSRLLRTLRGVHRSRVGSLAWNNNILTTGGMDGKIVNNDVRIRAHCVQTYRGHSQEVCGLKWSGSGQQLASGGNGNLLHIWDLSMAGRALLGQNQWVHRLEDHNVAVNEPAGRANGNGNAMWLTGTTSVISNLMLLIFFVMEFRT